MRRGRLCGGALAFASVFALTPIVACGVSSRPPLLGDEDPGDAGSKADAPVTFAAQSPTAKSCSLGPDGGVCACADQPLIIDPPNMYFVLDTSGSMNDDNKWENVQTVIKDVVTAIGPRAKFGAATFPNHRSTDQCAAGGEVFPLAQGDSPAGTEGPTTIRLLTVLGMTPADGGTPTAATLQALTEHLESLPGKTFVVLATDGGPNCNAAVSCDVSACQPNIESDVVESLEMNPVACEPTGPTNCCTGDVGDNEECLDSAPTLAAVTALAQAGIPVFVIGAPGSEPYASLLDQLAVAGGTALTGEPQYYAVSTAAPAAFSAALSAVAAKITATCTLQLDAVPADPSLVNVFFDEKPIPQSGPDGWTIDGATVTILGTSCDEITTGTVLDVRVVAGCPTQLQ